MARPCNWNTLNHIISSTDCVCYFLCDPDFDLPKFVTFGARDQDWKNFSVTKGKVSAHEE